MTSPFAIPSVSNDELLALESRIQQAQRERSVDGLKVFGFGEVSIAIGWPTNDPRFIAKRLIPMPDAELIEAPLRAIEAFVDQVHSRGGKVLPTETRRITRADGQHVGYVVQPIVPRDMLAETMLKGEPEAFHPLLVAVRDFVVACGGDDVALDAQIPNFAWTDGEVWLLDVTSPASFDSAGRLVCSTLDLSKQLVPAVLGPVLDKASRDIFKQYRGVRGALMQVVVFLHRVGADAWVGAAIETFNEVLEVPIDPQVVHERWEQNQKDFLRVKKLVQLQRAWQEKVRRRPFEYLITDSFSGEVL